MKIRPEVSQDCSAIENVHIAAFAHHPYSRQTEHLIVKALRVAHALTVSLVAEAEGKVVGHIAFSPIKIGATIACGSYSARSESSRTINDEESARNWFGRGLRRSRV
jgi:predicted N-acetyltransferase YhbS